MNRDQAALTVLGAMLLLMLTPPAPAELPVLLFDDFDDGDYSDWVVQDPYSGGASPLTPVLVPSPQGYALRGIGSGYSSSGEAAYLIGALSADNIGEMAIEMRAKSGPSWPNHAYVMVWSGSDAYVGIDYGEAEKTADFRIRVGPTEVVAHREAIGNRAYEWHDFKWSRDADGDWSLYIDGILEEADFYRDDRLTSFDRVALAVIRDQSAVEWVRVSGVPEPATLALLALGGLALTRRKRHALT